MAAVELQKSVIVPCCEAPYEFDITCFDWLCHLPRLDIISRDYSMNYVSRQEEFHFLGMIAIRGAPVQTGPQYILVVDSTLFLAVGEQ